MTKQEQGEKIVYGSLITSTKCYNCIHFPLCFEQKGAANLELASENDCCYYQSKLPKDSVVLSREEICELKYQSEEDFSKAYDLGGKETAEKIFKMLISKLDSNQFLSGKRIIMEVDVENLAKQFDVEIKE